MTREQTIIRTSIFGIVGNIILVGLKATIGIIVGSIAIVLDAVNNLTDALSSIITIIGTKISNKRPNKKHPFGYGRLEYLTSTLIGFVVLVAGGSAIFESIKALIASTKDTSGAEYTLIALIIVSLAVIFKIIIGTIFIRNGKRVNSDSLKASGTDALMDAVLSFSTLVAAMITYFISPSFSVEAILGIIIGLFIIKAGIEILKESLSSVIGERSDNELVQNIKQTVLEHKEALGFYDLIINSYGENKKIASAHMEVDENMRAHEIHIITKHIQEDVYERYGVILTLGVYAKENLSPEIKNDIERIIKDYPEVLEMHGFFVDEANLVVSFDLVIDFDCDYPDKTVSKIKQELEKLYPAYKFLVVIDADIS